MHRDGAQAFWMKGIANAQGLKRERAWAFPEQKGQQHVGDLAKGDECRGKGSSRTRRPHRSAKEYELGSATHGFSGRVPCDLFLKA